MRICQGCGGVLGRDCFNESECMWISETQRHYDSFDQGKAKAEQEQYYKDQERAYYQDMKDLEVVSFLNEIINCDTCSDYLKNKAKNIIGNTYENPELIN